MTHRHVRSREHLLHLLAEASELEHNLLCSYLYAAFSLKTGPDEGLSLDELEAVGRWRASIMRVCMEEMSHLAQVANLMVAVGSRPHFDRPNLPVSPGYHPARIQIGLAPFDMDALDHFIYLERPEDSTLRDSPAFEPGERYERRPELGALMPSAPDYETVGEFYRLLLAGLRELAEEMGEARLFVGPADCQMRREEIGASDLAVVTDVASAVRAIELIVEQGEGASTEGSASHFEAFRDIRREFAGLVARRPGFRPARPAARNPAMRRPIGAGRVHVTAPAAAALLDGANATYALMLRCLTAVYDTPSGETRRRTALLGCAMGLMKAVAKLATELTRLPADAEGSANAGITFAMLRSTEGLANGVDVAEILGQRFDRIIVRAPDWALPRDDIAALIASLNGLQDDLRAS